MKKDIQSSFTIMPIIVDNGFQGPQSSFNNFGDICSIARIEGRTISTKFEAEKIISENICAPGFRIIGISQRMFKDDIIDLNPLTTNDNYSLIRYTEGENATIVCFNFSLKLGLELFQECKKEKISCSVFNVTSVTPIKWNEILDDVKKTKNLIIIDDSKSANLSCDNLSSYITRQITTNTIIIKKQIKENWLNTNSDQMKLNFSGIINQINN
jgi:hypothetical protein